MFRSPYWEALEEITAAIVADVETGVIEFSTQCAERLFGYNSRGELDGMSVESLMPERFREKHLELRQSFMTDDSPRTMGYRGVQLFGLKRDGTEIPLAIGLSSMKSKIDGRKKAVLSLLDMSGLRQGG